MGIKNKPRKNTIEFLDDRVETTLENAKYAYSIVCYELGDFTNAAVYLKSVIEDLETLVKLNTNERENITHTTTTENY